MECQTCKRDMNVNEIATHICIPKKENKYGENMGPFTIIDEKIKNLPVWHVIDIRGNKLIETYNLYEDALCHWSTLTEIVNQK